MEEEDVQEEGDLEEDGKTRGGGQIFILEIFEKTCKNDFSASLAPKGIETNLQRVQNVLRATLSLLSLPYLTSDIYALDMNKG